MKAIATHENDEEALNVLTELTFMRADEKEVDDCIQDEDAPDVLIYEVANDFMISLSNDCPEIYFMREAFYSIANDYFLRHYFMWPIYISPLKEAGNPFMPYYEMTLRGLKMALCDNGLCKFFIPSSTR